MNDTQEWKGDKNQELVEAAFVGDELEIKRLLKNLPQPEAPTRYNY